MSGKTRSTIGSIFTVVGTAIGSYFSWTGVGALIGGALVLIGSALSYDGAKRQQREAERRARAGRRSEAVRGNVRGTHEHHLLVFGKTRVGGIVIDTGTSNGSDYTNQNIHIRVAHSLCHAGGCGGIDDIWIDDTRIQNASISGDPYTGLRDVSMPTHGTGLVQIRHWKGTATQAADTDFPGDGGGAAAYCRGMASSHFKLIRPSDDEKFRNAFKYGLPIVSVELKGIICYDPRLDTTNGGSGSHRLDDPTSWAWTDNPALCAATYMIMDELDGGMGLDLSDLDVHGDFWDSVAAAANIADETISTPAGNKTRYSGMGVVLSTADDKRVNLQKILDCMQGTLVPVTGSFKMYAGAYRAPITEIDESWLAGPFKVTKNRDLMSAFNAVRVNYDDNALDYKSIEAPPYTDSAYETEDGGKRLWHDMTLSGVTDGHRAQYIAQMFHKRSRYQMTVELTLNMKALDIEPWENVTLSAAALGQIDLSAKVFRVAYWNWTRDEGIKVVLEEENSDIYTVETFQTANTTGTSTAGTIAPPVPSALAATPVETGTRLNWTCRPLYAFEVVEVHRATSSGGTFSKIAEVRAGVDYYVDRLTDGSTYYYKIRARNRLGGLSDFTSEVNSANGRLTLAGSGVRLGDQRNEPVITGMNRSPAVQSAYPLTSSDVGASARINVAAHTVQIGSGTISYNAGTISGLGFATEYYVYADDPTYAGGAVTYQATTSPATIVAGSGRYYVGDIITVNDGGTGGGGGSGGSCVALESFLDEDVRAADVEEGKVLYCMADDGRYFDYPLVSAEEPSLEPCARLVAEGGAAIVVSLCAPITLADGTITSIRELVPGAEVSTRYGNELRREKLTSVEYVGARMVRRLHLDGHSYAAGERPDALIYTHNPLKP